MKINLDTIGFTEGRKLNVAHNLISGGIVVTAVGLLATFAGRFISTRTSTWTICHDPIAKQQVADICNAFHNPVKK